MRMTGYRDGQLRNDSMSYGRITYMNQLFKMPLLEGVYGGASIEAARLGDPLIPTGIQGNVASGSLFLAVDTPLGPAYLAYGHTLRRQQQRLLLPGQALTSAGPACSLGHAAPVAGGTAVVRNPQRARRVDVSFQHQGHRA